MIIKSLQILSPDFINYHQYLYKIVISKMPIFSTKAIMTMQFMQAEFNQGATCCKN